LLGYNINIMFDLNELVKRAIKYLIEGLVVALAAFAIPKKQLNVEEIIIIALTAAATFSILDVFIPAMGSSARGGAGFGIGANLVGGLKMVA
jgi:ABC-type Co2+ transport system permease subunit